MKDFTLKGEEVIRFLHKWVASGAKTISFGALMDNSDSTLGVAITDALEDLEERHWAYVSVIHLEVFTIGRADRNVNGYTPLPEMPTFPSWEEARDHAVHLNEQRGLSLTDALTIQLSSMRSR